MLTSTSGSTARGPQTQPVSTSPPREPWVVAHDFAFSLGGAERVSALLAQGVLDHAPLVTLGGHPPVFEDLGVPRAQVLHPHLFTERHYRHLSLAMPLLCQMHPPIEGNLLASSYAFAHHLRATGKTVVYCHSPLRQIWSGSQMYLAHLPAVARPGAERAARLLQRVDRRAALRAASYVANSRVVAERIERFYGITPSAVLHPPYDERFSPGEAERGEHYVWVGRIVEPYKRLEPLIEAFRGTRRRLLVVGDGRDADRLRASAPANVEFVGSRGTDELVDYYRTARAVVFPSEDDFGLVPVEAMACGTPVVALGRGGAAETVLDGETGVLFPEPTPEAIRRAVDAFERQQWDHDRIVTHARGFGREPFIATMRQVLESVV